MRDGTHVPCIGKWILNQWTTREVPGSLNSAKDLHGGQGSGV